MPARKFLTEFPFDPATFNWDEFKKRLESEISTDDDLAATKISQLTESNTALDATTKDLKVKLFDATVMKQGEPVAATDSPSSTVGAPGTAPAVPESDIFG